MKREETLASILLRIMRIAALLAHVDGIEAERFSAINQTQGIRQNAHAESLQKSDLPTRIVQPSQNDVR